MVDWNNITLIISLSLDFLILINVAVQYYHLRLPNIKYFLGAFLLFVLSDLSGLFQILANGVYIGDSIFSSAASLSFTILGTLCIVLFFETFRSESPLTRGNLIISLIVVINAVIFILIGMVIKVLQHKFYIPINPYGLEEISSYELPARFLLIFFQVEYYLFFILTLIQFMLMFVKIHQRIQMSKTTPFISTLKQMRIGVIVIASSFIFSYLFGTLRYFLNLVTLAGFFWIFWIYLKKGIYLLQAEVIRRLLIVDTGGVPLYSYIFSQFEKTRVSPPTQELSTENTLIEKNLTEEVIFSGALKAISSLFTELTGAQQTIKEIILDRMILLIQQSPNKEYIVVLFVDQSTQFYRDALLRFTTALFSNLQEIVPNQRFSDINERIAEKYIQEFFGFRKPPKTKKKEDSITYIQAS